MSCNDVHCDSRCCTETLMCATTASECVHSYCDSTCPSNCCVNGMCQGSDDSCQGTSSLVLILLIIFAVVCVAIFLLLKMRKAQLRRQLEQRQQRREQALANRTNPNPAPIQQNNLPQPAVYQSYPPPHLGVEPGSPFREGPMKDAYELLSVSKIEYGDVELTKRTRSIADHNQNRNVIYQEIQDNQEEQVQMEEVQYKENIDTSKSLSIGDLMLRSEYDMAEPENDSENKSGLNDLINLQGGPYKKE